MMSIFKKPVAEVSLKKKGENITIKVEGLSGDIYHLFYETFKRDKKIRNIARIAIEEAVDYIADTKTKDQ